MYRGIQSFAAPNNVEHFLKIKANNFSYQHLLSNVNSLVNPLSNPRHVVDEETEERIVRLKTRIEMLII